MNRYNSQHQQIRELRKEVEKLRGKSSFMMIVSLVVAGFGAYTGWQAYRLQEETFVMNIEPILTTDFFMGSGVNPFSLVLINEGISPIVDIGIRKYQFYFGVSGFGSQRGKRDWRYIQRVEPRDSTIVNISKEEIELLINNSKATAHTQGDTSGSFSGALAFSIRYRRVPDHKLYHFNRYLYVREADNGGEFFVVDDEMPDHPWYRQMNRALDSITAVYEVRD